MEIVLMAVILRAIFFLAGIAFLYWPQKRKQGGSDEPPPDNPIRSLALVPEPLPRPQFWLWNAPLRYGPAWTRTRDLPIMSRQL